MPKPPLYFFIGTTAEFLKVMPVMRELSARGIAFKIIASGQNELNLADVLSMSCAERIDITLNTRPLKSSVLGLLAWFAQTLVRGIALLKPEFRGLRKSGILIVHGDTVSTVMGALIGKIYGLRIAHIEAGLRSFNFFQPFPEEIDRYVTSFLADIHFCPRTSAEQNLRKRRGIKIHTGFNTNIDSLSLALQHAKRPNLFDLIGESPYFIFIMHRQENLLNKKVASETVRSVLELSNAMRCVFVMHALTRKVLTRLGMIDEIEGSRNVIVVNRLPFVEFVELLRRAEFMVTDGGGNQQEAYYLGKPCLILRNVTEGDEGLGKNAVLSRHDGRVLRRFVSDYQQYLRPKIEPQKRPSDIIVDALIGR